MNCSEENSFPEVESVRNYAFNIMCGAGMQFNTYHTSEFLRQAQAMAGV